MPKRSAGLIPFRRREGAVEILIGHMGGPFWARKQQGAWTIFKGEHDANESPLQAARREFAEETGIEAPAGEPLDLGEVRQSGGKLVRAWAIEADLDERSLSSSTFAMEWPPRSGREREFAEIDDYRWCALEPARELLVSGQLELLDRLLEFLGLSPESLR